jgi:glycosyltransferase involved in cell wall biosynthesis
VLRRILLTTDAVGGVWRYSLEVANGFASRGARVLLAVIGPAPTVAQRMEAAAIPGVRLVSTGLPLDWLADTPAQVAETARALAAIAARARVQTVQLHTPAFIAEAAWPAPVIVAAHSCVGTWWQSVRGGAMPADLAWRAEAVARGLAVADAVITPSRSFATALLTRYGVSRPIHAIHNGRRPIAAAAMRGQHVLTAGRLWDAGKNIATIDAAAALLERPVLAAGPANGPNGARIECRHLQLLGSLEGTAMAAQFAAAPVFVSLARYEPFGLAVLEAAQAGCALVLSDIATFRELWDCAALFVDPDDPVALAELLNGLLRLPARCAHLGDLAAQRARAFDADAMVAATWAVHLNMHAAPATLSAA